MHDDISKALQILRDGGIILYPTDTIWGIGCDATNDAAVKRVYALKQREDNKSMIVLMDSADRMFSYIDEIPEIADQLIEVAEKPLTLILNGAKNLAPSVVNQSDGSIGIRVVKDEFCHKLIQRFRKPIVSTSANISGTPSPSIFDEIDEQIIEGVDYVVKHKQTDLMKSLPSGIIKVGKDGGISIIRE